jgi:hypothetical protein
MGEKYSTDKIIAALRETNGLVSLAAKRVGCDRKTIHRRAKAVRAVREAIDDSREELVDQAELALRAAVLRQQPWAVALVLRTLGRERGYVPREEQVLRGDPEHPVQHKVGFDFDGYAKLFDQFTGGAQAGPEDGPGPADKHDP